MWACFMQIHCDPTYLTYFTNGACALREKIPVRMLEITMQVVIALDVNVTYVQPYSRTTYANDVKFSKLERCPYLTLATPHIAGVTLCQKKPNVNDVKNAPAGRTFLNRVTLFPIYEAQLMLRYGPGNAAVVFYVAYVVRE